MGPSRACLRHPGAFLGRNDLKLPVISAHLFSNLKMGTCFVWGGGEVGGDGGGGWGWGA